MCVDIPNKSLWDLFDVQNGRIVCSPTRDLIKKRRTTIISVRNELYMFYYSVHNNIKSYTNTQYGKRVKCC